MDQLELDQQRESRSSERGVLMADYYSSGRYSATANSRERSTGLRFPMWNSTDANDGSLGRWNNSTLLTQQEVRRDHVCKPVIIGSDGKAMPAVFECPPQHNHAKDDGAGGYGRSWAGQPAGGDLYGYKNDPYKAPQAFISGVHAAASTDGGGRFGLGAGGKVLQRPKADLYEYDDDGGGGDDEYGRRTEPWRSAEAGRGWQTRRSAGAEPNWGIGSKYGGGGAARAAEAAAAVGWGGEGKLSRATNVIDKAAEFLWDASPRPAGGVARTDLWDGAQQPASMYQPAKRSSSASSVIDSREAAKKYGGQFIW